MEQNFPAQSDIAVGYRHCCGIHTDKMAPAVSMFFVIFLDYLRNHINPHIFKIVAEVAHPVEVAAADVDEFIGADGPEKARQLRQKVGRCGETGAFAGPAFLVLIGNPGAIGIHFREHGLDIGVLKMMDVQTLPIRLTHTPTTCRVHPVAGIKLGIGRCFYFATDTEQRAEGVERVEPPIEAKRKFVEISL